MFSMILLAVLTLAPLMAHAGGTARCTTWEGPVFHRWLTECTDGSRAVTKYDAQFRRYRTDVITPLKGEKPRKGWPTPGKAPR